LRQEAQRRRRGHWEGGQVWMQEAGVRGQDQLQAQPGLMDPMRCGVTRTLERKQS